MKKSLQKFIIPALAGFFVLCSVPAKAATVLQYSFTGATLTPTLSDANGTGTSVAWGAGLPGSARGFGSGNTSLYARSSIVDGEATDYLEFTANANTGYVLDLASFSFLYGFTDGSAANPQQFATFSLFSSVDSFATAVYQSPSVGSVDTNALPATSSGAIDLSGAPFQGLTTITFRLFLGDDGVNSTNYTLRVDELNLQGLVVAVPEPATCLLMFGGFAALFLAKRLSSKRALK